MPQSVPSRAILCIKYFILLLFVQTQTTLVVFSWNDMDPTAEDGSDAIQHQIRGSASVNLLGGLIDPPTEPSDTRSFTLTVNNVCIYNGSFWL